MEDCCDLTSFLFESLLLHNFASNCLKLVALNPQQECYYFENKVEVIGFASPRNGKVLKFLGHFVSSEFQNFTNPRACKTYYFNFIFEVMSHSCQVSEILLVKSVEEKSSYFASISQTVGKYFFPTVLLTTKCGEKFNPTVSHFLYHKVWGKKFSPHVGKNFFPTVVKFFSFMYCNCFFFSQSLQFYAL